MLPLLRNKSLKPAGFSQYVSRSQMETFVFDNCLQCRETVVRARVKSSQKTYSFNPKPVGGSEIDPAYDVHRCAQSE